MKILTKKLYNQHHLGMYYVCHFLVESMANRVNYNTIFSAYSLVVIINNYYTSRNYQYFKGYSVCGKGKQINIRVT